jgi:hypothetical protein
MIRRGRGLEGALKYEVFRFLRQKNKWRFLDFAALLAAQIVGIQGLWTHEGPKNENYARMERNTMKAPSMTRRDFVRLSAGAVVAGAAVKAAQAEPVTLTAQTGIAESAGRKIRFVSIGTGIRGCDLLRSARKVPTGVCVGTADLYDMHQRAGIEAYGAEVPTSRDYRALLDRKDVDAVIVAVADFQHRRVVLDALAAGKDVYCEKPMSHNVADGLASCGIG